ncbi:MAG: lipocalin family protein [Flavobacterium sp.]
MKKLLVLFIGLTVFSSCTPKVDVSKIDALNGYWQINKAVNADDDKKEYPVNEVYDYYDIKDKAGFHKKVTWQPDGTFLVNNLQDKIKVIVEKEKVFIEFSSEYGKYSEELESISNNEMVLVAKDQTKFYYKKVVLETTK